MFDIYKKTVRLTLCEQFFIVLSCHQTKTLSSGAIYILSVGCMLNAL